MQDIPDDSTKAGSTSLSEHRKRRREWLLILTAIMLVLFLTRFESQLFELTSRLPISNSILVLGLININILLVILFLFLIFRNLFKLFLERRRKRSGARLRNKLVATFIALSLIPTMMLFFVSAGFITNTIENWFNNQIEDSLQESLEVAQTYYRNSATNAIYYAEQIAKVIKNERLLNDENLIKLRGFIQQKQEEYNLGIVEVFSSTHEELVRVSNPQIPEAEFTHPDSDTIKEALLDNRLTRITPVGKADLIRGIVPVYSNWNPKDVVGVIVVNYYVPYSLVNKMREISASFEQYKNTKLLKEKIKLGYIIVLLLIALVIIFMATWFGFHLAREITVPIIELSTATNKVANGELNVKIDIRSDDEIGSLVDAFNQMTFDLRRGQERIQQTNLQLRKSNLELEQRRQYMEVVLKNISAGVISVDKTGRLTTVNKSAEKLLKLRTTDLLGKNFKDILKLEHLTIVKELIRELLHSGKSSVSRQISLSIQNNRLTLMVNVTTLRNELNEFLGTVVVFDDLTHLFKAQKMAAWREVARRIAHEIKNPLTPIQLSAQRLRRRYLSKFESDDNVFDECTHMIIRQVDELKNLVNEFSSFARMPASNPTKDNLNHVLQNVLVLYQEGYKQVQFTTDLNSNLPEFEFDANQIKRVLINLLENAVAATDYCGEVIVTSRFMPSLQMVTFTVADNGCGIKAEDKSRLFEPYFSTKKTGTGLGLSIVASIISDHNGYIRVRDNHPCGTKFIVELPVQQEALHS